MQTDLSFKARCYSSRYLPITANEPEVSPIGLRAALKKKVDIKTSFFLTTNKKMLKAHENY